MEHWELLIFFFGIAFVYSSVGFGGGSSYLAILALYQLPYKELRLIALICNIIVVLGATIIFISNKQVNLKKIIPLVLVSVPLAYWGATLRISEQTFFIVLGFSLVIASIFLWVKTSNIRAEGSTTSSAIVKDGTIGGVIGFLSGMVGIGGGIFLSPVLNLTKWDTPRRIAATASVFILVNSISGIAGQITQLPSNINYQRILLLCVVVLIGGQLGSRMGAIKLKPIIIRRVTAILVLVAGINVLYHHLPWLN